MSSSDCAAIGVWRELKWTVSTKTRVIGLARQKAKNGVDRGSLASLPVYQVWIIELRHDNWCVLRTSAKFNVIELSVTKVTCTVL